MTRCALVVDDEADIRELLAMTLTRMGWQCEVAHDLQSARDYLHKKPFQLCLTDLRLPDGSGQELVEHIEQRFPQTPVAVITAHGSMDAAVIALKAGAYDFVSKPLDLDLLRKLVHSGEAIAASHTPVENYNEDGATAPLTVAAPGSGDEAGISRSDQTAPGPATAHDTVSTAPLIALPIGLLGTSPQVTALRAWVPKLSASLAPVWVSGPAGSGRSDLARHVHESSARASAPFTALDCVTLQGNDADSTLLAALQDANGGTLYLENITALPAALQHRLSRVLDERRIKGGLSQSMPLDVRLICTSVAPPASLAADAMQPESEVQTQQPDFDVVASNRFRQDLLLRLHVLELELPPLQQRREDIAAMAEHYLANSQHLRTTADLPTYQLTPAALDELKSRSFPANIRELENVLLRATNNTSKRTIDKSDLPAAGRYNTRTETDKLTGAARAASQTTTTARPTNDNDDELPAVADEQSLLRQQLLDALEQHRWNRKAAARELGLTYRQLRYRLARLDIDGSSDTRRDHKSQQ